MLIVLLFSCRGDAPLSTTGEEQPNTTSITQGGGGLSGGGGEGLGGGYFEAGPTGEPQSLAKWSEYPIAQWGPVTNTIQVEQDPGPDVFVNVLATPDPFTPTYQLPSGAIINTARPIEDIINGVPAGPPPPVVEWNDQGFIVKLYEGEILITFVSSASQLAIEQFISSHELGLIFSWFRPDQLTGGNEIAWFHFAYDVETYPAFADAYAYFSSHALVQWVEPNSVNEDEPHYDDPATSGYVIPNDQLYSIGLCRYVTDLGIDTSPWVPFGPASEYAPNWFSRQVVAVMDDGVYRDHPDSLFI